MRVLYLSFALLVCLQGSALAQDELAVQQMGDEFISNKDAGIADTKAEDLELSAQQDYQSSVLSDPYTDSYARMNAINNANHRTSDTSALDEFLTSSDEETTLLHNDAASPSSLSGKDGAAEGALLR